MGDLSLNKLLGAGLATALTLAILWIVPPLFFHKAPPSHAGYAVPITVEVAGGPAEVADTPPDWGTMLPKADVAAGEAKTAVCRSCHSFDPSGTNNIGPGLYGVLGRKPGSHPGFAYSSAMLGFGGKQPVWDYDHVYDFIKGPQAYLPGTKMTFIGLKSPQDRINVIAYLHTLGSNLPVPAAKPSSSAQPAAPGAGPAKSAGAPTAAPAGAPGAAKAGTPTPSAVQSKAGGPA